MPQHIPRSITPDCFVGSHTSPHSGHQNPSSPDTSNLDVAIISSAAQIGRRLATIGDEVNRTYNKGFDNKMAHIIRQSMYETRRIVGNCQNFALSLLRSVKNMTSRVDHGVTRTPGRRTLVATRDRPATVYPNLLLLAALVAVFGLVIKLGLDD